LTKYSNCDVSLLTCSERFPIPSVQLKVKREESRLLAVCRLWLQAIAL